jgi:hypothetical protein
MEVKMLKDESPKCFDTLESLQSLEALLEETFRICEKVLSQPIEPFPAQDAWDEEIEAEHFFYSKKMKEIKLNFKEGNRAFNNCFIVPKKK